MKVRSTLRELKVEVTGRCLLRCVHCSSESGPAQSQEMSHADCVRILSQAAKMGVKDIAFSGGEPLLWPWLDSAVACASDGGARVTVYSSGNVPAFTELAGHLKDAGARRLVLSIHGATALTHDGVTGVPGSFAKAISAAKRAGHMGYELEAHFVPMRSNHRDLPEVAALGQELGMRRVSVLRFVPQGRGRKSRDQSLGPSQNRWLAGAIGDLRGRGFNVRIGSPYSILLLDGSPRCMAGVDRMTVVPDLRIYPCDAFKGTAAEAIVGTAHCSSLKDTELRECWEHSPYLQAVREHLPRSLRGSCASCRASEACRCGCLAQSYIASGQLGLSPDPDCLMIRKTEAVSSRQVQGHASPEKPAHGPSSSETTQSLPGH